MGNVTEQFMILRMELNVIAIIAEHGSTLGALDSHSLNIETKNPDYTLKAGFVKTVHAFHLMNYLKENL